MLKLTRSSKDVITIQMPEDLTQITPGEIIEIHTLKVHHNRDEVQIGIKASRYMSILRDNAVCKVSKRNRINVKIPKENNTKIEIPVKVI